VDEAIELLTGLKAGQPDGNGKYPEGTFNNLVMQRLERFYEISIQEKK